MAMDNSSNLDKMVHEIIHSGEITPSNGYMSHAWDHACSHRPYVYVIPYVRSNEIQYYNL